MKNKNILVTGAFGFVGKKIIQEFLEQKNTVICVDKQSEQSKKIINKLKKKYKDKFFYFYCDFESNLQIETLINFINHRFSQLDVMINNASITGDSLNKGWNVKFNKQSLENFEKALKVNLVSIFQLSKGLKKIITKKKTSSIINISSIYSSLGPDKELYKGTNIFNPAAYGSSKAGIEQLTRWLAVEFAPNARVNCIAPGGIERKQSKNFIKKYTKKTLLKRMATEDDVVNLIMFLASDKSDYITGQEIVIDGGLSII